MRSTSFPPSKSSFLRVQSQGFLLGNRSFPSLLVNIKDASLVRKKFKDRKLVCYSPDGEFSKEGSRCKDCTEHGCNSRIRLVLNPLDPSLPSPLLVELSFTSVRNFFEYESHLSQEGIPLYDTQTMISVVPRGSWGEIIFSTPLT